MDWFLYDRDFRHERVKYNFNKVEHCVKGVQIRSVFWSVFSCTRTEYRDLRSKSPYSVRIQENTDQKILRIWTLFTQWRYLILHPDEVELSYTRPAIACSKLTIEKLEQSVKYAQS